MLLLNTSMSALVYRFVMKSRTIHALYRQFKIQNTKKQTLKLHSSAINLTNNAFYTAWVTSVHNSNGKFKSNKYFPKVIKTDTNKQLHSKETCDNSSYFVSVINSFVKALWYRKHLGMRETMQ